MPSTDQTVKRLIVAPHCDDEVLGCGGLLAKYPDECGVLVLGATTRIREKEFEAARDVLGYKRTFYGWLDDGFLDKDMHQLVGVIDRILTVAQPEELYIPTPGTHQDHVAVYEAGVRAARPSMSPGHHFVPNLYAYDVAAYDLNLYPSDLRWNIFEVLTEAQIDAKVEAMRCYASQRIEGPHPANGLKATAQVLGQARRTTYVEQYALMRRVRP